MTSFRELYESSPDIDRIKFKVFSFPFSASKVQIPWHNMPLSYAIESRKYLTIPDHLKDELRKWKYLDGFDDASLGEKDLNKLFTPSMHVNAHILSMLDL